MKNGVVVKQIKPQYGPIADAIKKTGIDILSLDDQSNFHLYDNLIVFYNKPPLIVNRSKNKIAWWMNDLRLPNQLPDIPTYNFDDIFICHKTYDQQYKDHYKKPLHYMPQCGHSHRLEVGRRVDWDISFIGKVESNRVWHKDRKSLLSTIGSRYKLSIITGEGQTKDQAWIYNQTKYNLAVSFPMIEGTSNRLYNILASQGLALVRYFPGLEKQFENHKHLIWFNTVEEAIDLIKFYDNKPLIRDVIKKQGNQQYLLKHTAEQRINNIFDIMLGKETKFRGYL